MGIEHPLDVDRLAPLVLDRDDRYGGDEALAELEREHGKLPETLTVLSGRGDGGRHQWFKGVPGPVRTKLCRGVDILCHDRNAVVVPPTLHSDTGLPYRFKEPVADIADGDALPFISSNAMTIALGSLAVTRLGRLARAAEQVAALSHLALRGSVQAYDARVHAAKDDPAASGVAARLSALLDAQTPLLKRAFRNAWPT